MYVCTCTSANEEDQIGVEILRDEKGPGLHGDEADSHGSLNKSAAKSLDHLHLPCISLHHMLGVLQQEGLKFLLSFPPLFFPFPFPFSFPPPVLLLLLLFVVAHRHSQQSVAQHEAQNQQSQ